MVTSKGPDQLWVAARQAGAARGQSRSHCLGPFGQDGALQGSQRASPGLGARPVPSGFCPQVLVPVASAAEPRRVLWPLEAGPGRPELPLLTLSAGRGLPFGSHWNL